MIPGGDEDVGESAAFALGVYSLRASCGRPLNMIRSVYGRGVQDPSPPVPASEATDGDLHLRGLRRDKYSIAATAVDPLGRKLRQESIGTTDEEIRRFLEGLPGPTQGVLEACNVWEHIYDAAASTGAEVL